MLSRILIGSTIGLSVGLASTQYINYYRYLARKEYENNKLTHTVMHYTKRSDQIRTIDLYAPYGLLTTRSDQHIDLGSICIKRDGTIQTKQTYKQDDDTEKTIKFHSDLQNIEKYCRLYRYNPLNFFKRNDPNSLPDEFSSWQNEWKKQEIQNNQLGHIQHLSHQIDFQNMYKSSDREKIDYMANIIKTMVYFEQMIRKYDHNQTYESVNNIYDSGPYPRDQPIKSFNSIGVDSTYGIDGLLTPMGYIAVKNMKTIKFNYERNQKIAERLELRVTIPSKRTMVGYYGPFLSIGRDIDGNMLEGFEYNDTINMINLNHVSEFWRLNRDLILYRTMQSIESHPIVLD